MATFGKYVNWGYTALNYWSGDTTGWRTYTTWGTDENPVPPAATLYAEVWQTREAIALAKHLAKVRQPAGLRTRVMYRGFFIDVENQTRNIKVLPRLASTYPEHIGALRVAVNDTDQYVFAIDELVYSNDVPYAAKVKLFFTTPAGETEVDMTGLPPMHLYSTSAGTADYRFLRDAYYITPGADRLVLAIGTPTQYGLSVEKFAVVHQGVATAVDPLSPPTDTETFRHVKGLSLGPTPGSTAATFECIRVAYQTTPRSASLDFTGISPEGVAARVLPYSPLPDYYNTAVTLGGGVSPWSRVNISESAQIGWNPRVVDEWFITIDSVLIRVSQLVADFYVFTEPVSPGTLITSISYTVTRVDGSVEGYAPPIIVSTERNSVVIGVNDLTYDGAVWTSRCELRLIDFFDADAELRTEFRWEVRDGPSLQQVQHPNFGARYTRGGLALGDGRYGIYVDGPESAGGGVTAFAGDTRLRSLQGQLGGYIVVGSGELVAYIHTTAEVFYASTVGGPIDNSYFKTTRLTMYLMNDEETITVTDADGLDEGLIDVRMLHLSSSSIATFETSALQFGVDAYRTYRRIITHYDFRTGKVIRVQAPLVSNAVAARHNAIRVSDTSFVWTVWELSGLEQGASDEIRGRFIYTFTCVVGKDLISQTIGETYFTGAAGGAALSWEVSPLVGISFDSAGPAVGPATIVIDNGVYQVYSKEATEVSEDPGYEYYFLRLVGGPYDQGVDGFSARTVTRVTKDLTYIWPDGLVDASPPVPFVQRG